MSDGFHVDLSEVERAQLGSVRLLRSGAPSAHPYPSAELWPLIRTRLVERSLASNPALDVELTAYTPGETIELLEHPTVAAWHTHVAAQIPTGFDTIVFVPCAKTKPWTMPAASRSKAYSAYNRVALDEPGVCFVTISEPLGIVPMQSWGDFPQYDNPGLFRDDSQRSGMTTVQWNAEFGACFATPFDELARKRAIDRLGACVGSFIAANATTPMVAFVDNRDGTKSTHSEMLDVAVAQSGVHVERFAKQILPRMSPYEHLRDTLAAFRASAAA